MLGYCIPVDPAAHHFAGRVLAGVAIGGLTHVVPMYIAEVSLERRKVRTTLTSKARSIVNPWISCRSTTACHHSRCKHWLN